MRRVGLPRPAIGGRHYWREPVAKKNVIEIDCDRCGRIEHIDPETTKMAQGLELSFQGEKISWPDLCTGCHKAVGNYLKQIKREGKKGELEIDMEETPAEQGSPSDA